MKIKTIMYLLVLFLLGNITVYILTDINLRNKIDIVLKDNLNILKTHYNILLQTQKITASTASKSTLRIEGLVEIMAEASNATKKRKKVLRKKLHNLLKFKYERLKEKGVLQFQFVLPNNISFYRAHKPSKFGDDLTNIRPDFRYTNETKKPTSSFIQGKVVHGFRNIFPIFDKNNKYVGAMEISFSSDNFQWYLNNISQIHTHFLINKKVFDFKAWQRDDLILKYDQSAESSDYLITLGNTHSKEKCIDDNFIKLQNITKEIETKIALGNNFSSYARYKQKIITISFLSIKNMEDKNIAWIVSYEKSPIIKSSLNNILVVRVMTFFLSLLIIYFLVKLMQSKQKLEKNNLEITKQHKLLKDILNATDNIMFITDIKDVKYSNNKFKNLLNIESDEEFNKKTNHNLSKLFVENKGSLHIGLLQENESPFELIIRTPEENRIVTILDKDFNKKIFKINMSKTHLNGDYLITLSDITKMQEHHMEIEKKTYIDTLTNIYNRNKFDEIFAQEIKNSKRYNTPFSIAIIDIDKFKNFNDNYGHLIGDEVLIIMAQSINNSIRETDIFARWGGEEFIILFKNTPIRKTKVISQNLKNKIKQNTHATAGKITASFGLTEYINGDTTQSMFNRCDDALYLAKENGRDRVEVL